MYNLTLEFRPKLPNMNSNPYDMQILMQIVGFKIGYDEINARKDIRENFLFIKRNEVGKNGKNYQMSQSQFVETNKLDHRTRIQLGRSPS